MSRSGPSVRTLRAHLRATTAALAILFSAAAWAQDASPPADNDDQAIIVTGSRIARPANVVAPPQVTTVGEESIELSGLTNVSRAVRAPNIGELFAPAGENFAEVADPCNGVTAVDDPGTVVDDNCRSIPEVAARIAATGSFTLTQPEIQGTGGFTGGGNPDLSPETADSWNVGVVIDRDFNRAGRVQFSVDYFKIEIDQLIDTIDRQQSVDLCFNAQDFPNAFCGALVRDTTGPVFQQGELTGVNSGYINEGRLETSGVDVSVSYNLSLDDVLNRPWGDVSLRANYAHLLDFEETKFGVNDAAEGEVGFSEHKVQGAIVYNLGPVRAQWETTYLSDAKPDIDPESLFFYDVGSYTHDVQVGLDVFDSRANLYIGANNVFDEDAPIILSGVPGNTTGTDTAADVYDPIGRRWYAGARVRF
jgi:outer membrane receptor protein involved in Fe transport